MKRKLRERLNFWVGVGLVGSVLMLGLWLVVNPDTRDVTAAEQCQMLYARATTAVDSATADVVRPNAGRGKPTCAELRRRGLTD